MAFHSHFPTTDEPKRTHYHLSGLATSLWQHLHDKPARRNADGERRGKNGRLHLGAPTPYPRAGSPYAVKDYYDIDPDLAVVPEKRMEEFQDLVERTHQAGLRMLMDFIPNHVARQYHSDARPNGVSDLGQDDNRQHAFNRDNNFYYIPDEALHLDHITAARSQAAVEAGNP